MEASDAAEGELDQGKCRDWRAAQADGKVLVYGWCTFPTAGYNTELKPKEPQGINPADLLLERVVTLAPGYQPPVKRGLEIHWEHETDTEYETVTILPDGVTVEVQPLPERPDGD